MQSSQHALEAQAPPSRPLKPVRLHRKPQADSELGQEAAPLTPDAVPSLAAPTAPAPPPLLGSGSEACEHALSSGDSLMSAESSATDLLACGLFEEELDDLAELLKSHSPKYADQAAPQQLS